MLVSVCRCLHTRPCFCARVCVCVSDSDYLYNLYQGVFPEHPSLCPHWLLSPSFSAPCDASCLPPATLRWWFSMGHKTETSRHGLKTAVLLWFDLNQGVAWAFRWGPGFSTAEIFQMIFKEYFNTVYHVWIESGLLPFFTFYKLSPHVLI